MEFSHKGEIFDLIGHGEGPLDACLEALKESGFSLNLLHYEQRAIDEEKGVKAQAMSIITFGEDKEHSILARAIDTSTARANVKAVFNALNLYSKEIK